ncbi:MAG: tRNA (adenosine(37)-N6)-threonylcarbamoyltransferase complex ATPase subunit type 1 TsaE [Firmicutes bacterium]|nr:tRNA (adenosine(37)-N6)-threonylcarbamoyltransferase complex ATPase subunit type 1 TsaE [Bacillota bacterium]
MNAVTRTSSESETEALGRALAEELLSVKDPFAGTENIFVAMFGDLGAGKTAFVRGMADYIAPDAEVSSPTYAIMNEYSGKRFRMCHFDMYRITGDDDLYSVGFYDLTGVIIVAEWCENIPYALPEHYVRVNITKTPEDGGRIIEIRRV